MANSSSNAVDEAQIRGLMDERAVAVRAKDVDKAVAHYAPDAVLFDVIDPLQYVGADAARERLAEWFASFTGSIDYEPRDLNVVAGDNVAFCHSLNRVNGTRPDGSKIEMWWRATVCCRKLDGRWQVTHEHSSVPLNVQTGKASIDLQP